MPTRSIGYAGRKLNLYYGDLHEHSDISVCNRAGNQTQDQSYQSMRDIARYDFAALTDHGGGYGKAAVYAPELSRTAVIEALRTRHTFGTTGVKILLDVRVNSNLMGEIAPPHEGRPVKVDIRVVGASDLDLVDVCGRLPYQGVHPCARRRR